MTVKRPSPEQLPRKPTDPALGPQWRDVLLTRIDVEDYAAMEYEEGSSSQAHLILHEGTLTDTHTSHLAKLQIHRVVSSSRPQFQSPAMTIGNTEVDSDGWTKAFKITIDWPSSLPSTAPTTMAKPLITTRLKVRSASMEKYSTFR